jgi:protein-disulfide isomerase
VGFVAALGVGFLGGQWAVKPKSSPTELVEGDRFRVELRGDEPTRGPADALVTIVMFSDFECPYCAKGAQSALAAAADFPEDVRVVFKHYPLPFHSRAMPAARAAWAAHQLGKFWEFHDFLYEGRGDLSNIQGELASLGIDPQDFGAKMTSEASAKAVDEDTIAGGKVGVSGTPAYAVNGHVYAGARSESQWEEILEAELRTAKAMVAAGTPRDQVYAELMKGAKATRGDGKPVGGAPSARAPERRPGEPATDVVYRVSADDRATLGPADALVTVVVFSDFQCPYCKRLAPVMHEIVKANADVRVVFRQMPLPNHSGARPAARAAVAAGRQGKFWEMHDRLFERGPALREGEAAKLAEELGLDAARFAADLADPAVEALIDEDVAMARQFGVMATPTCFVNGRYVRGAQTTQSLQVVVEEERAKAQKLVDGGISRAQVFDHLMQNAATAVSDAPAGG